MFNVGYQRVRIGIDPGQAGAIVVGYETSNRTYKTIYNMPATYEDMSKVFKEIQGKIGDCTDVKCYIEKVHAWPSAVADNTPAHKQLLNDISYQIETISMQHPPLPMADGLTMLLARCKESLKDKLVIVRGATSTWTFAAGYGAILQVLADHNINFEEITTQSWQKELNVAGGTKDEHKKKLKAKAEQLFPEMNVTLKNCDALLIYRYGSKPLYQPNLL